MTDLPWSRPFHRRKFVGEMPTPLDRASRGRAPPHHPRGRAVHPGLRSSGRSGHRAHLFSTSTAVTAYLVRSMGTSKRGSVPEIVIHAVPETVEPQTVRPTNVSYLNCVTSRVFEVSQK